MSKPDITLATATFFLVLTLTLATQQTTGEQYPCQLPSENVHYFDIKLPKMAVPESLTTYVCYRKNIRVNIDESYHAVGFLPLISNREVMHHMILFGCPTLEYNQEKPHHCDNADGACRTFLVQWSKGIDGPICSPPQAGVRFGQRSVLSMALQIHWNNQNHSVNLTDNSGVRVFYTKNRRKYELGNVQIGQNDLEIPPRRVSTIQSGSCSSDCTREFLNHPIYITRAHIHMHYLGNGGSMHLIRNGTQVMTILEDKTYEYNSPPAHYFVNAIQVLPGDDIKVTCNFNSKDGIRARTRTVTWGEGSDGEMCYAFVSYYPKIADFDQCIQFDNRDICDKSGGSVIGECIFPGFVHIFQSGLAGEIIKHCTESRLPSPSLSKLCSQECEAAIREVTGHPCMQDRLGQTAMRKYLPEIPEWDKVKDIIDKNAVLCF